MALCRARISSEGPVIREVPVSRMAAQPQAQRVSPVPTCALCGGRGQSQSQESRPPVPFPKRQRSWGSAHAPLTAPCGSASRQGP